MSNNRLTTCGHCGGEVEPGGRYCVSCGVPVAAARPAHRFRAVLLIVSVAASVALVVFLRKDPTLRTSGAGTPPPGRVDDTVPARSNLRPLSAALETIESVRAVRNPEALSIDLMKRAADTLAAAGRTDHAAAILRRIAGETDAIEDWKRTGDLWMRSMDRSDLRVPGMANEAIEAYRHVLALDPTLLDVRTDLATAYLGARNPEAALLELRLVLVEDTTHLPARFNYGVILSITGRPDEAIAQFARTMELSEPGSMYHQRSREAIRAIEERNNIPGG